MRSAGWPAWPAPARARLADVLELLCTEVRSAFGYERAAVLHHDAGAGTVLPVVRQRLDWPDCALQVAKLPFVAEALARREAVASRGEASGLESPVAVPLFVAGRCPAIVVADRPAEAPDDEALDLPDRARVDGRPTARAGRR